MWRVDVPSETRLAAGEGYRGRTGLETSGPTPGAMCDCLASNLGRVRPRNMFKIFSLTLVLLRLLLQDAPVLGRSEAGGNITTLRVEATGS